MALIDSGSDISIINKNLFEQIINRPRLQPVEGATSVTGQSLNIKGKAYLPFKIGGQSFNSDFYIIEGIIQSMIIGSDFLEKTGARLDYERRTISIDKLVVLLQEHVNQKDTSCSLVQISQNTILFPNEARTLECKPQKPVAPGLYIANPLENSPLFIDQPGLVCASSVLEIGPEQRVTLWVENHTDRPYRVKEGTVCAHMVPVEDKEVSTVDSPTEDFKVEADSKEQFNNMPIKQRTMLGELLKKHESLFAEKDTELGQTNVVHMNIDTGSHPPIRQRPYRTPFAQRPLVEQHIASMIDANVIEPSTSPWASPIVIVPKKDGSKRFCVDYRKLNAITTKNAYPLPCIDEILGVLNGVKYLSCLDLKSGYWQVAMATEDKPKTAFITHEGLYQFNVMPFGLTGAPSVFQNLMNNVLAGANTYAMAYLDDVIIFSRGSYEDHLEKIEDIFRRLSEAGLKLKLSKCSFLKQELEYLGHIVSPNGIRPNPDKVEAISKMESPCNVKEVRQICGMMGFYRRFIYNYAKIAVPLTQLTKKNAHFRWSMECEKALDYLKDQLLNSVTLAYPDPSKPYHLYTDASQFAIGAILTQDTENGERPLQYISKTLSKSQRVWPVIQREAYALVYGIQKLRQYLWGAQFTVYTDHKPLRSLFTAEMKNPRIQRWAIILEEYACTFKYKTGKYKNNQ